MQGHVIYIGPEVDNLTVGKNYKVKRTALHCWSRKGYIYTVEDDFGNEAQLKAKLVTVPDDFISEERKREIGERRKRFEDFKKSVLEKKSKEESHQKYKDFLES